jgi:hypothetical protein
MQRTRALLTQQVEQASATMAVLGEQCFDRAAITHMEAGRCSSGWALRHDHRLLLMMCTVSPAESGNATLGDAGEEFVGQKQLNRRGAKLLYTVQKQERNERCAGSGRRVRLRWGRG